MQLFREIESSDLSRDPPAFESIVRPENLHGTIKSFLFAIITIGLILSSAMIWTYGTIEDGTAYDNSRWSRIGEAYETIEGLESESVIFIGSSRTYSAIDGSCLDDESDSEREHWNLAMRGDFPYLRLPETEMIAESGAEVVVLEAGPNSLQSGIGGEGDRLRWQVFSLFNEISENDEWYEIVKVGDRKYLLEDDLERAEFLFDSRGQGLDELSHRIVYSGESRFDKRGDGKLPEPDSEGWVNSLKTPEYDEVREYSEEEFEEYLSHLLESSFWTPESGDHPNSMALKHIISRLDENGVTVVLFSPPVHPEFLKRNPSGRWDVFNESMEFFSEDFDLIDMTWEEWEEDSFDDPHHLSEEGRQRMCQELVPILDEIIEEI